MGVKNRHSKKFIKIFKTETIKENDRFGKNGFDHRYLQVSKYVLKNIFIFYNSGGRSLIGSFAENKQLLSEGKRSSEIKILRFEDLSCDYICKKNQILVHLRSTNSDSN